ncbi:zeta toxin family protein [Kitasatospora sp. NPDC051853]|uniref:zeta toxin family protein n=1 Tax=Kitasatospora sp. NPDC051853 TaxID=3364058 RepID=UPI00379A94B4
MAEAPLAAARWQRILDERILPSALHAAVPQNRPVMVLVAGQPAAGKTSTADFVHTGLGARGGAVRVASDLYKPFHPAYQSLVAADPRTAGRLVRSDVRAWAAAVEERVRAGRFDMVVETALADPDEVRAQVAAARAAGYRIEVMVVATAPAWSQLGIAERYIAQVHTDGAGRYVGWDNHDRCLEQLVATLAVVEDECLAERVSVVRLGGDVLYTNTRTPGGAWELPAAASAVVAREHGRPWTAKESRAFEVRRVAVDRALADQRVADDHRLAAVRDTARALALAEPVRRTTQPLRTPPGTAHHRLSAAEHRQIFEEDIVPLLLDDIVPSERPVAIFVLGQPGAGKTRIAHTILHGHHGGSRPTHLSGDNFKSAHPDYFELMSTHPRTAGELIREDYQAWQRQAFGYVRERRGSVLIEIAPGSAASFAKEVAGFRRAGHRIEVVAMAVRAADSRQGTALRYAAMHTKGVPARFTTASGHDRCLAAVQQVLAAVDTGTEVDSVLVVKRGHEVIYRNQRGPDGRWEKTGRAALAHLLETTRPYTDTEARLFAERHRYLAARLPQYRHDLAQIAALAAPLMPPHLRPAQLTAAGPATSLPLPRRAGGQGPDSSASRSA